MGKMMDSRIARQAGALLILVTALGSCASRVPVSETEAAADRLLVAGKYSEALRTYSTAAYDEDGGSYRALIGMSTCYALMGDAARFEAYALEASSAAPHEVEAHARLGRMYVHGAERFRRQPSGRRYAQIGVEYLRRVFASRPEWPNVVQNIGLGLYLLDDRTGAVLMLEEAHRRDPSRDDALHLLLLALRDLGDWRRADQLLTARAAAGPLGDVWKPFTAWIEERRTAARTPDHPGRSGPTRSTTP